MRENHRPHTALSLSIKTRAPIEWFQISLEYLEKNTDWLEIQGVSEECHPPDVQLPPDCHPGDEEGNGKKGMEEKRAREGDFCERPSWKEFWDYCQISAPMAEFYAKDKFLKAEESNWKGKENWRAYASRVRSWWENDGRPKDPFDTGKKPKDHKPF
jgi:hypothetical protein